MYSHKVPQYKTKQGQNLFMKRNHFILSINSKQILFNWYAYLGTYRSS